MSQSDRLDQDIPSGSRFDRTRQHGELKRVGCKLIEQRILTATADNVKAQTGDPENATLAAIKALHDE